MAMEYYRGNWSSSSYIERTLTRYFVDVCVSLLNSCTEGSNLRSSLDVSKTPESFNFLETETALA